MEIKKRLMFYFYITDDFFERKTNLISLECLRHYAKLFDYAEFYLSIDDLENYELINKVECEIIGLRFKGDISFHIHKNDQLRESGVFKKYFVDRLNDIDDMVFFGHGKGFTNLDTYEENSMLHWILGCYYLSLEFMDEVDYLLSGERTFSAYGSFPLVLDKKNKTDDYLEEFKELYLGRVKYGWCYSGTFFWVYPPSLTDHLAIFRQEIPRLHDRYYSEKFLGNVMSYPSNATGHNLRYLFSGNNMYNDGVAESCINFILTDDEKPNYYKFREEILNSVKERYGK